MPALHPMSQGLDKFLCWSDHRYSQRSKRPGKTLHFLSNTNWLNLFGGWIAIYGIILRRLKPTVWEGSRHHGELMCSSSAVAPCLSPRLASLLRDHKIHAGLFLMLPRAVVNHLESKDLERAFHKTLDCGEKLRTKIWNEHKFTNISWITITLISSPMI